MPNWKKVVTSGSNAAFNSLIVSSTITGSISGSLTGSLFGTASWAEYVVNGGNINTSGFVTTSSFNNFTASYNTGSFTGSFSGSFTGSLNGIAATASYYQETDPIFTSKSASLATTGSNTFTGTQIITGSSGKLIYTGYPSDSYPTLAEIHKHTINDYPWLERFYNDTFSTSSAVMAYFGWNDGRFVFHNESTESIGLQVNGYSAENGLLVYSDKVAFVNNVVVTGSLNVVGGITGSLFGTSSWAYSASQALTASYISTLYSSNFTASFGSSTTWTINHNLNTRYVIVQTFDSNHNQLLPQDITLTNTNTVTATFSAAESGYAVVTVGGALLNNATPGGSSGQVQYNNGGAFDGTSKFTFDGTYTELYGATGYKALSTLTSDYYTTTDLLNYRLLSTTYVTDFVGNTKFAGDVLEGVGSANTDDLIYLDTTDAWIAVDQSDSAKATRMLGIYDGTNIFTEGYVVVGENGVASSVPLIAGTLTPGAPVYIKESATTSPFLDTTVPTSGVVRILGHLIRNEGSGYWFMRFRPDHTWVTI